jgi:hypothetical protein
VLSIPLLNCKIRCSQEDRMEAKSLSDRMTLKRQKAKIIVFSLLIVLGSGCSAPASDPLPETVPSAEAAPSQKTSVTAAQDPSAVARPLSSATVPVESASARSPSRFDPIMIPAQTTFSYIGWIAGVKGDLSKEDQSQIASVLYEAAVRAGIETSGRYTHLFLPSSMNPGFDVNLDFGIDLILFNPNGFDMTVGVSHSGGRWSAEIAGPAPSDWHAAVVKVETESFDPGQVTVIDYSGGKASIPGIPGKLVRVFVNGKLFYKDFYTPVPAYRTVVPTPQERSSILHNGNLTGG